ncbi:MAG: acyltransferase family protein [Actinomycetota bacterium]
MRKTIPGSFGAMKRSDKALARIEGIDAARAVAIIGMVMVHFAPGPTEQGPMGRLYGLSQGRAAILFVVLAGLGVSLLAGSRSSSRRRVVRTRLAFRAMVLLPAGLALQLLDVPALVILQHYSVFFLLAACAVALSDRALLGASVAVTVLAPVLYLAAWHWQPSWFTGRPAVITDPPLLIIRDLMLTGAYPVLTWMAPLLFGMWLGRQDIRLAVGRWRTVIVGTIAAIAAWGVSVGLGAWLGRPNTKPSWLQLVLEEGHSQMPLWLVGAIGSATGVLALALLAVNRWPRITWPLVAMGQLALTIYVAHLIALALWPGLLIRRDDVLAATVSVIRFTAVTALFAVLWRKWFSRGPLEALLHLPWSWRPHSRSSPLPEAPN